MNHHASLVEGLAFAALLVASSSSHAALTVFTSEPSFLAAVTAPGVDTFAGLPTTAETSSPITRSAGPYPYSASSTTAFFGAGTPANPALSTNVDTDVITFFDIGGGANAIGGLFFGSDTPGSFVSATIVLTVTDSLGATLTQTLAASPTSFLGFVSNGTIATLVFGTATPGEFIFPTVDDLTLAIAAVSAVPESETWSLLVAGLMALAYCGRRRRRRS
jgi:hypothetical protein